MLELSRADCRALAGALKATRDRRHWVRLRAVALAADGVPAEQIQQDLGLARSTYFGWLAVWRETHDPAALADAPRSGRRPVLDAALRQQLETLLGEAPDAHGYRATAWTVSLLQHHFAQVLAVPISDTTLRRVLHALGYRWKRPRYVLARRDPERAGKKAGLGGRGDTRASRGAEHGGAL